MTTTLVITGNVPYFRVSTKDQDPERQVRAYTRWCVLNGVEVSGLTFRDKMSASGYSQRGPRAGFEALVAYIESGRLDYGVVWLDEVSRATRNEDDYMLLAKVSKAHDVTWWVAAKNRMYNPAVREDRNDLLELVVAAMREVTTLARRVKESVPVTLAGQTSYSMVPFGYQRIYDPVTRAFTAQVPHPEHGPILREIADRYARGVKCSVIAADLNARGVPTPFQVSGRKLTTDRDGFGQVWLSSNIAKLVTNPVYIGQRHYRGGQVELRKVYDAGFEPLVDEVTFLACLRRKAAEAEKQPASRSIHLLAGVATCGVCGGGIGNRFQSGRSVYRCRDKSCVTLDEVAADRLVLDAVVANVLPTEQWRTSLMDGPKASLADNQHRLTTAQLEAEALHQEYEQARHVQTRTAALKTWEAKLDEVERIKAEIAVTSVPGALLPLLNGDPISAFLLVRDVAVRRAILRELVTITLHPRGKGVKHGVTPEHCAVVVPVHA